MKHKFDGLYWIEFSGAFIVCLVGILIGLILLEVIFGLEIISK